MRIFLPLHRGHFFLAIFSQSGLERSLTQMPTARSSAGIFPPRPTSSVFEAAIRVITEAPEKQVLLEEKYLES